MATWSTVCKSNKFESLNSLTLSFTNQNLWILQTGTHASEELVKDFESACEDDDALVQD